LTLIYKSIIVCKKLGIPIVLTFKNLNQAQTSSLQTILLHTILGVILLSCSAQMSLPLKPIPVTLQSMAVMLIALQYNRTIGLSIILSYLGAGLLGLPVFAHFTNGWHVLLGHSGGYLLGFIPAVIGMNYLKSYFNPHTFWGSLINCMFGTGIIFICGITLLSLHIGLKASLTVGLLPFIIPGFIKAVALSISLKALGILKYKK